VLISKFFISKEGLNMLRGIQTNLVVNESAAQVVIDSKVYDGFYVSFDSYSRSAYGCDTTALVVGQMQKFYILKGDHRKQYAEIFNQGFDICLDYYKNNIADSHKYSDKL
jgi:hypothetical protein